MNYLDGALCLSMEPDAFYPEVGGDPHTIARVKAVCRRCPAIDACRDLADATETEHASVHGIWGGESPRERIARRRGLRIVA